MDDDTQPSLGPMLDKGTRHGRLVILSVAGQYVAQLGLMAFRCDKEGHPLSALLPDGSECAFHDIVIQSNPRRVRDEDDGA